MNQDKQQHAEHQNLHKSQNKYKTIMLIGRSGDGKNPLTDHLGGKPTACSEPSCAKPCAASCATSCARLYISEGCKLNIIDTKGLDGSKTDHQEFMNRICKKTISYVSTAIDAIIIMWSPLNNGHLVLLKTITALQESFGKDVIKSCIFMIQGNWESVAKLGDLDKAKMTDQIKEIEKQFPHVPVEKYETKSSAKELKKQLANLMKRIEPYQVETFKAQQNLQPEKKPQGNQEKLPKLEENKEEEEEEEKDKEKEEEVETIQPIVQEERVSITQKMKPMTKSGLILTVSGAATGMAAIAFEQSIFLAAGTIGVTCGALCLAAAAGTGAFHGLSWAMKRARGIRA